MARVGARTDTLSDAGIVSNHPGVRLIDLETRDFDLRAVGVGDVVADDAPNVDDGAGVA